MLTLSALTGIFFCESGITAIAAANVKNLNIFQE